MSGRCCVFMPSDIYFLNLLKIEKERAYNKYSSSNQF